MEAYIEQIAQKRAARDKKTASNPLHWLNLAGLFWLEEGENTFGNDPSNKIVLPNFPGPFCGSFAIKGGKVSLHPAKESRVTVNDKAPKPRTLRTDKDKNADFIEAGPLTMKVIIRGGSPMLRVWDRESEAIRNFTGFHYYPAKTEYLVIAKYVRYDPPKPVIQREIIGTENNILLLGQAEFTLNGVEYTLIAEQSGNELLFNFRDGTNNDTTYGGGRKFYLPSPEGNEIILDFNLTENWPCAYTPYATCPIPPKENHLSIKIEAGELKYHE